MPIKISSFSLKPSLAFATLSLLMMALWLAGGASRGDAAGQVIVRAAAFLALIVLILFGKKAAIASAKPVWVLLGAAIVIAAVQLLPLPTGLWSALPGRQFFNEAAVSGTEGAWRSWSLAPGATINALVSLFVPLAILVSLRALGKDEKPWLLGLVLSLVAASTLLGLMQFSGAGIDNPLINDTPGVVSGTFANRNHFALFLALGCLLVPVWMLREGHRLKWRGPVGLGLLLLFMLMILATGSRAGMMVGALAIAIAGIIAWPGLSRGLRRAPRWVLPTVFAAVIALLASFVLASVAADRAVSIERSLSMDVEQDMRNRALPTVWDMARNAFPAGNGLGGFDPMFRIDEPFDLLKPTYFNQAHNDFLGVLLDAGLPGLLLMVAALAWWAWASVRAWRGPRDRMLPRLGSAMILLVIIASVFDYPARTPMIMAMLVIAATWLSGSSEKEMVSALPGSGQQL
jgi:O-antigen ligase